MKILKYSLIMAAALAVSASNLFAGNIGRHVYGLFTETYEGMKSQELNPGDTDGGYTGAWKGDGQLTFPALSPYYLSRTEGSSCMKAIVYGNGGWWIQFGYNGTDSSPKVATDMSAYAGGSLEFSVRASTEMSVKIEWGAAGGHELFIHSDLGVPLDMAWHKVSVPLSSFNGIDLTQITIPAGFHMKYQMPPPYSRTYYIDDVYWKKPGTGSVSVALKNNSDGSPADSITWEDVNPGITHWKAAEQHLEVSVDYAQEGWGILVYTDNTASNASPRYSGIGNPAGLVGYDDEDASASSTTLSMCWRVVDVSTDTLTINRGATVMELGDPVDYPDRLWSGELTKEYPCFFWMQDVQSGNFDREYATAWNIDGIQHAESTWGGAKSPNYVYFGADFSGALTPRTYRTNKLTIEIFYE